MATHGTVLVVDNEPSMANRYASYLKDRYTVRTAYVGEEALELLDEGVDVVLLDWNMPGLSGDDVLERIKNWDLACRVVLVTTVVPDINIIEMGFDDYLVKPISEDVLRETVETSIKRAIYDAQLQEYFSLVSKRTDLEEEKSRYELQARQKFKSLSSRIDRLERDLDDSLAQLDEEDSYLLFDR